MMPISTRWIFLPCSLAVFTFLFSPMAHAQPGDDVESLQRQLREIKSRIENIQRHDDPFGKRVRTVGRQRVVKPEIIEEELTLRFYDLSDVFSVAPQYPAQFSNEFNNNSNLIFPIAGNPLGSGTMRRGGFGGGGFGGGGGGVFNVPPGIPQQQPHPTSVQAARVSVESLVNAVKQNVAPEEWADTNGDATVSILGNTLLISATESMHEQIANVLDLFREQWGKLKTVSVQAFWIKADSQEVNGLLENDGPNPVVGKVERKSWRQFLGKAEAEERIAYSANLCGQNGQTLHAVSGKQHYVILDAKPLYTFQGEREAVDEEWVDHIEQSVAGLLPLRGKFQEGAALQISPLATRGGKFLILDIHTRINEYAVLDEVDADKVIAHSNSGGEFSVDLNKRPYVSYRLSTTVRCPNNDVVLAGGMTYDSPGQQPNMYLFVKSNIHTIEEDKVNEN